MTHYKLNYEAVLHAAGHRVTQQRVSILDAVCEGDGHTTLGEIFARVHLHDFSIDRSTLYRTLKLFVELGLVVSADTGDGETYYEIAKSRRHHHLVCRQCGNESEIDHSIMQPMFDQLFQSYGFTADSDHIVVFGLCNACLRIKKAQETNG